MNHPLLWGGLLALTVVAGAIRLTLGYPLLRGRSVRLGPLSITVAVVSALALVFHCAAMFFGPWINMVPFLLPAADMVRAMGPGSQTTYWLPAVTLVLACRCVWWPFLAALIITLVGVGVTMYWPFSLVVHLGWLAAVIIVGSLIPLMVLRGPRASR